MRGLWLGLDVGTQSTKALVVDGDARRVVARASVAYDLIAGLPEGAAEQDPKTWADAVVACLRQVSDQGVDLSSVRGVGVSGQQHGLVLLDAAGGVVRPAKLWCDTATASEAAVLSERFGRAVPTGFTASKILWVQEHEPENWAKTATVMLPHDYINFLLTGRRTMEVGDASGSGLFDPVARGFNGREVELMGGGVGDRLPELVEAPEPVGAVSAAGSSWCGLPAGALVSAGGGDNMMSAIGSGATTPGPVVLSLGTSGTVFACADRAVIDPDGLIAPFCDSTGRYLPLLCTMNVTGVTEEVREAFGMDHGALTERASSVAAGCEGLLWLPFLAGERVPDLPTASGTLTGMRHGWLDPAVLFRAAIEGTTLNLAWGAKRMAGLGVSIDAVRVVGGGSKNALWRQVAADVFGVPVVTLEEPESAALGGAIQAMWTEACGSDVSADLGAVGEGLIRTGGEVEPSASGVAAYAGVYERYCGALARVYGV
ncbi:xylulokinase [Mucisphaera calidilacus]|uniref:Xylulose kinase n=1 Tax=Mucisphaera calidilacus TaxID=2527982 RepID=A0A518BZ46_9BACT|nr:xylulokinase [Mucisphaera calidilacus]QDU72234.1 Xylulose kinase [Mucisphaera calidilacus]